MLSRRANLLTSEPRPRSVYQAAMPIRKKAPTTQQAAIVCMKRGRVDGLNAASKKLVICAR